MKKIIQLFLSSGIATFVVRLMFDFQERMMIEFNTQNILEDLLMSYWEHIVFSLVFGISYLVFTPKLANKLVNRIEKMMTTYSMQEILMYIIGFTIGLGIANFVAVPFRQLQSDVLLNAWYLVLYVALSYSGVYIVHIKKVEMLGWFRKRSAAQSNAQPKIIDTSVIIDGRILDLLKTRIIDGKIIIPEFVLDELRHIADASDKLKRERGRRGLDILNELQQIDYIPVEITAIDYKEVEEVDVKLVKLANQIQGTIITNDFNLNKVAKLQKVTVLNINDVANAVKPILLPNEELVVTIAKEGKEQEQGIAYLNDGTMVVVEQGRKNVGQVMTVKVTKVLQTSAGRMIFAKKIDEEKKHG